MGFRCLLLAAFLSTFATAQTVCPTTPAHSICDIVFELNEQELRAHPNPYLSVNLHAELRSPRHRTLAAAAFWDGGNRMVIRFAPTEDGEWDFRISGNIERFNGKQGKVTATPSDHPGFPVPANVHHWMTSANRQPHLWLGDTRYEFAQMPAAEFEKWADARAAQKFTHVRGYAIGDTAKPSWTTPDQPDIPFHKALDERIAQLNRRRITVDLILGRAADHLLKAFPSATQRERYIRYMAARYAAYDVTWQLVQSFEEYTDGRELLKQLATVLKTSDPYAHPRTAHANVTSAPLLSDGWMDHVLYYNSSEDLGSIEHQIYTVPFVNIDSDGAAADADAFRKRLWNASMNGQYPVFGNGSSLDDPGAKVMGVWREFFAATRYWELEPYFDLDGARAVALPGTEYIVYLEKPSGPIEVRLEKHGYDVKWVNPATGEATPVKGFNAARQSFDPPDNTHDWVLHISREGRKEGMLRSYKFESRLILMQEVETALPKIPFEIAQPATDEIKTPGDQPYEVKLKRETRGTRAMMYLWTAEAPSNGQGYRVLGVGAQGKMSWDKALSAGSPSVLNMRLYGMNANGKVYVLDRIFRTNP